MMHNFCADPDCWTCADIAEREAERADMARADEADAERANANVCPRVAMRMECAECAYPYSEAMCETGPSVPHKGPAPRCAACGDTGSVEVERNIMRGDVEMDVMCIDTCHACCDERCYCGRAGDAAEMMALFDAFLASSSAWEGMTV